MTKIAKQKEPEEVKPTPEETVDNRLEFLKGLSAVNEKNNKRTNPDWVMAKLDEKGKEWAIEMMANAYYGDQLLRNICKKHRKWTYNKESKTWKSEKMSKEEDKVIIELANKMYGTFMIRIETLMVLSRNVKNNWLVRLMSGASEEEVEYEKTPEEETVREKVLKPLKSA